MAPQTNIVYYKPSQKMTEVASGSVDLIITSPPYFNIKDYSSNGFQTTKHSEKENQDIGGLSSFKKYITELLKVWKECERVL